MRIKNSLFLIPLIMLFAVLSCSREQASFVGREKLFTLNYGRFEDEIDLFQLDSNSGGPDTQIFMKDGMFYISNSGSKKILQLTSFGDLLSVFYNPETNPEPSFTLSDESVTDISASTRKAVKYPFNHPVFLCVDSLKRLFVVDQLPQDRFEYDANAQIILRDVVLRFNSDGRFLDYLGQEGPGGTPFPPITGLFNNSRNETIIIGKTQTGLIVFWFSSDGNLLFRIPVSYKNLPAPYESGSTVLPSLEKIIPDPDSRKIYLKIDYYVPVIDSATKANAGISYEKSCIYPFDISSGSYENYIDIPSFTSSEKAPVGTESFIKPYEFLGITSSGWFFLSTPVQEGYVIEMLDSRTRRIHKRTLSVAQNELAYNAVMLSSDGILSALLATSQEASIVWWRTDSLIGEIRR